MVSQVDSLVKEQLPVDSLVKKLRGQDCVCTNSGDGDAKNLSTVCVCVVGKSCGCDFQDEKRDNDYCDDLNEISLERRLSGRSAVTACPINGCAEENSARHYIFVCQTATLSSQQQPGQLEIEKAAPEENSADAFVGNTLPAACDSHGSTST
ncbi:hypothetical protein Bpfe_028743 [Biomphalaria pfeifferi]|uniref:Uncharacterized protein n=1 Tax=Biomphalaria pfeifferi TaxID=112525 RepID=A0AAD8ASY9_BIOPF|nr:hypothetical protein Bpfe_028743 [Biomphalaria pfeifferi]